MRAISFSLASLSLAGCLAQPLDVIRIACGFADVLVAETDLQKVNQSFLGADAPGSKLCRAVRAIAVPPSGVPAGGLEEGPISLTLPSGESVTVTIVGTSR